MVRKACRTKPGDNCGGPSEISQGRSESDSHVDASAFCSIVAHDVNIWLTVRYQASFSTFERAGYNRDDAAQIMIKSVKLADQARNQFLIERKDLTREDIRIALSIGPFGASLFPAQEFDGYYPPPYGPRAFSEGGDNLNAFRRDSGGAESIDALAQFHSERLSIFTNDRETWDTIDCIAFETVPLTREVLAIRRAVGMLRAAIKPWWISLVFTNGVFPETEEPGGRHLTVIEAAHAVVAGDNPPSAIGVNCTQADIFPALLAEMRAAIDDKKRRELWLVLYPNGGDVYDSINRTWKGSAKGGDWGKELAKIVQDVRGDWGGVLVGGCCRTGPEEIQQLSKHLSP